MNSLRPQVALAVCLLAFAGCAEKAPKKPEPVILRSGPPADAPKIARAGLASPKDLVCGMDLEEQVAFTRAYKEKQYGFCSNYCAKAFEKDQEGYLKNPGQGMPMPEHK